MIFKWSLYLLVGVLFAESEPDKALPVPAVISQKTQSKWVYAPSDPSYWSKVLTLMDEKRFKDLFNFGAERFRLRPKNSAESDEGGLAASMALRGLGLNHSAFFLSLDIARRQPNTEIGKAALNELKTMHNEFQNFDRALLEDFLVNQETGVLPPDLTSFVASYRYLYDLRYGNTQWAKKNKSLIEPASPWDFEIQYWEAVGAVARQQMDFAKKQFQRLSLDSVAPEKIRQWSQLQTARLTFEDENFEESMKLYQNVGDLGLREKGRLLLEKAWNKYYLKQYDKSLGLLTALKAPYFVSTLSPERFVLETIIYRDLCLYDSAHQSVLEYQRLFKPVLSILKKRAPLRTSPELIQMALLNRDIQPRANLIDGLRREKELISRNELNGGLIKFLLNQMSLREKRLVKELDIELEPRLRKVAEEVLARDEQIQFLDYTAKLDKLRIVRDNESRDFRSERVSYLTFDSIYWPVDTEFWWDEFRDYKVLLSSQCQAANSGVDPKVEREFK